MLLKLTRVEERTDEDGVITVETFPYLLNPMRIIDAESLNPKLHRNVWAAEISAGARTLFTVDDNTNAPFEIVVADDITDVAIRCGAV